MTPEQTALIQGTWARLVNSGEDAAALFYERLFALDPSLRGQFRGDIASQGKKLVDMMQSIVGGLDHFEQLLPAARELGRRHHYYGVRDEDYGPVGEAMLWMLAEALGDGYTPEADRAWRELYALLAAAMIEGATDTVRAKGSPDGREELPR